MEEASRPDRDLRQVLTVPEDTLPNFPGYLETRESLFANKTEAIAASCKEACDAARACLVAQLERLDGPDIAFVAHLLQHIDKSIGERFDAIIAHHRRGTDTHERGHVTQMDMLDRTMAGRLKTHLEAHIGQTLSIPTTVADSVLQPVMEMHPADAVPIVDPRVLRDALNDKYLLYLRADQDSADTQMFDIVPIEQESRFVTLKYRANTPEQMEVYVRHPNEGQNVPGLASRLCDENWRSQYLSGRLDLSGFPATHDHRFQAWSDDTGTLFHDDLTGIMQTFRQYNAKRHGIMLLPQIRGELVGNDGKEWYSVFNTPRLFAIQPDLLEPEVTEPGGD